MNLKDQLQNCTNFTATSVIFTKPKTMADPEQDMRYKKWLTDDDCKMFADNILDLLRNGWIADIDVEYNIILENAYGDHLCHIKVKHGEPKIAVDCTCPRDLIDAINNFTKELKQKFAPSAPSAEYFEPPRVGM